MKPRPTRPVARVVWLVSLLMLVLAMGGGLTRAQVMPTNEWVSFFSANSTVLGQPVPAGAIVRAFDSSTPPAQCGEFTVLVDGIYGVMPCYRDDPDSPGDEGAEPGDRIAFTIDGQPATPIPISLNATPVPPSTDITWTNFGDLWEVDLQVVAPPTSTPTATPSSTATATVTPTSTSTSTSTATPSPTTTPTASHTAPASPTATATQAISPTPTSTSTATRPSMTPTASPTTTATASPTATVTGSPTPSPTPVPKRANLSVTMSVDNPTPQVGDNVTFIITARNAGPDTATNVAVLDLLPAGVTFVSAVPTQGTCLYTNDSVVCTLGSLGQGEGATVDITVAVNVAGRIANTAIVSANESDPDTTNNVTSVSIAVIRGVIKAVGGYGEPASPFALPALWILLAMGGAIGVIVATALRKRIT